MSNGGAWNGSVLALNSGFCRAVVVVLACMVIAVRARMLPTNVEPLPRFAELSTCQYTLHSWAPLMRLTWLFENVVSVESVWKTNTVLYTSMASGDLDLWTMKPDGSAKKQITKTLGYDGGPVFSRDGKMIVWRAGYPKTPETTQKYKDLLKDNLTAPMKMELMVANADGSGARQITNFGCASFAPTFTPDGKKILFATNKQECDSRKFDLFLINVDGTGLKQVTTFGGFTSFPEFSPDGKTLAFCADYHAKERYEFNIFTTAWEEPK